jgi:DNA invertase Pin-like site-specific DNA recombinase
MHCVAYIRQSSEEAAKRDLSCPAQEQRFLADVAARIAKGEPVTYEVAPWDEGKSGGDMNRSGLQWILDRLDSFQEVWVYDHDRLVRHAFFGPYIMNELRSRGIRLWVSQGGSEDASPMGRFMTDIRFRFGAYYREEIGETQKRTRDYRLKEGLWSGHAPTGYKFVYESGENSRRILVPDPDTAPKVQAIFKMLATGESQKRACRLLDINPPTWVWQRDNPLYIGLVFKHRKNIDDMTDRRYDTFWALAQDETVTWIYPGRQEPLIDKDIWDAVERRRLFSHRHKVSETLALSGVFKCRTCNGALRIRQNHGWPTLRCDRCRWEKSYRHAEATVLTALSVVMESEEFEQDIEVEIGAIETEDRATLDALFAERSKVSTKLNRALDRLLDVDEVSEDIKERAVSLKRRRDTLDKEILQEQARIASKPTVVRAWRMEKDLILAQSVVDAWQQATPAEQRTMLRDVFGWVKADQDLCVFAVPQFQRAVELTWRTDYPSGGEATTRTETRGVVWRRTFALAAIRN